MSDWKRLGDREIHADAVVRLHHERWRAPGGAETDWTVVDLRDGAAVLAIEDDGSIHLVRQYRPTVGAAMWELPAGRVEEGEPPLEAARRELEEEAGLVAREWISLGAIWPLDGVVRHRIHHFVARGLSPRATAHETFEDITVHRVSRDELRRMIAGGELVDGVALALLARWAAREGEG